MKKLACLIFFTLLLHFVAFAQSDNTTIDGYNPYDPYNSDEDIGRRERDRDSTRNKKNVIPMHYTWKWAHDGVYSVLTQEDSVMVGYQIINPMMRYSQSNTYLATIPSPYQPNIFLLRTDDQQFYYNNLYRAFLFKPEDALLFNTTTPYSVLSYTSAGSRGRNESTVNITHIQNILPFLNAGFRFNLLRSDGRYQYQPAKIYDLSVFSNCEYKWFAYEFFINQNTIHNGENGGVQDRAAITDTTEKADNILVNMDDGTQNDIRNFNLYTGLQFKFGKHAITAVRDTVKEVRPRVFDVGYIASDSTQVDSLWLATVSGAVDSLGATVLADSAGVALARDSLGGPPLDSAGVAVTANGPPDDSDEASDNLNNKASTESGGSNDGDVAPAPMLNYRHSLANDSIPETETPLEIPEEEESPIETPESEDGMGEEEELEEQIMDTVEVVRYDTTWYYIAKFLFSLKVEDDYREFRENPVSTDFFAHNYINSSKNKDAFHDKIADFTAKIVINELPKHPYMPGIFAGVDLDYRYNHQRFWSDTALSAVADTNTMHLTRKYSSLYLTAGLFNVDTNARLTYDVNMRLCLLGEHIGNFTVGGYVRQDLSEDKTSYVRVDASYALEDVNIYWKYYSGNHDYWFNKNFDMEKKLKVEAKYVNDKWRLETGVGLTNRGGYVWMDSTFNIRQESKPFSTYTLWAKEHFRVWDGRINFIESVYFQKSSREKLLSLPIVSIYSSTYVELVTKNKALRVQIGVDLRYDSKFYADNYRPSTMTFYNQRIEKQGNLLTATAFLNARISRCILFAKYEHFDYYLRNGGNYFSAYAYPIDPPLFRWGLRWSFFN